MERSGARDRFASCPMARWNERTRMHLSQQRTPRDKAPHRLTRKYDQLARVPSIQFKSARGPGGRCQPTIQTARTVPRWHAYCAPPALNLWPLVCFLSIREISCPGRALRGADLIRCRRDLWNNLTRRPSSGKYRIVRFSLGLLCPVLDRV